MAKNTKGGSQSNSVPAEQVTPDAAPAETTLAGAPAGGEATLEAVVASEAAPKEPAAEVVDIVSAPVAVIEEAVESATEGFAAAVSFDSSLWSKKSLELWSENAAAFFALVDQVSKAQTFEEIVDLQSRFANERFEAFIRQSKELMEVAKNMATLSAAPLCEARKVA